MTTRQPRSVWKTGVTSSGAPVVIESRAGPAGTRRRRPNIVTSTPRPVRSRSATSATIEPGRELRGERPPDPGVAETDHLDPDARAMLDEQLVEPRRPQPAPRPPRSAGPSSAKPRAGRIPVPDVRQGDDRALAPSSACHRWCAPHRLEPRRHLLGRHRPRSGTNRTSTGRIDRTPPASPAARPDRRAGGRAPAPGCARHDRARAGGELEGEPASEPEEPVGPSASGSVRASHAADRYRWKATVSCRVSCGPLGRPPRVAGLVTRAPRAPPATCARRRRARRPPPPSTAPTTRSKPSADDHEPVVEPAREVALLHAVGERRSPGSHVRRERAEAQRGERCDRDRRDRRVRATHAIGPEHGAVPHPVEQLVQHAVGRAPGTVVGSVPADAGAAPPTPSAATAASSGSRRPRTSRPGRRATHPPTGSSG